MYSVWYRKPNTKTQHTTPPISTLALVKEFARTLPDRTEVIVSKSKSPVNRPVYDFAGSRPGFLVREEPKWVIYGEYTMKNGKLIKKW